MRLKELQKEFENTCYTLEKEANFYLIKHKKGFPTFAVSTLLKASDLLDTLRDFPRGQTNDSSP